MSSAPSVPLTKKAMALAKKAAASPLNSTRGLDPTLTVVEKKPVAEDEAEGRPNKKEYDSQQDSLRAEIAALTIKSVSPRSFSYLLAIIQRNNHRE